MRNGYRYPPRDYWNDREATPGMMAQVLSVAGEERQPLVATLYIPDPEQESGWRSWYVYRDGPKPPEKPRMGFK